MPTQGEFCNFSCNDRIGTKSCLGYKEDFGGDLVVFEECPPKLKGETISIRPILHSPTSALQKKWARWKASCKHT